MRLFLVRFARFMLLAGLLAALLHAVTLRVLRQGEEKSQQDGAWERESDSVETLVLGDSHAMESIDARRVPSCFTYAVGGESLPVAEEKLRWALAEGPTSSLRHLVLAIGLHSFTAVSAEPPADSWYYSRHADCWRLAQESGNYSGYFRFWLQGTVFPWAGRGETVIPRLHRWWREAPVDYHEQLASFYDGASPSFTDLPDPAGAARARALTHLAGRAPFHPAPIAALGRLCDLCRDRHLTLTVLDAPVTDAYYQAMSRLVDPARYQRVLDQELRARGIDPLDLHGLFTGMDDHFRDPDHLRPNGRLIVTQAVAGAIASAVVPR